ncbi:MAG: hypothetical protein ACYCSB_02070 [bacterium]
MEGLKPFKDLCKYDDNFIINEPRRSMDNEESYYNEIIKIKLNNNVPKQIKTGFINAIHLLIYSMYYRNFDIIAKEHALIVLEHALKIVYEKEMSYCKSCKTKPKTLHLY